MVEKANGKVNGVGRPREVVLDLRVDGSASSLHFDKFSLGFLGKMKLERASEICFDDEAQSFYVNFTAYPQMDIEAFSGFAGYDVARSFEVIFLQYLTMWGLNPELPSSVAQIAARIREQFDAGVDLAGNMEPPGPPHRVTPVDVLVQR